MLPEFCRPAAIIARMSTADASTHLYQRAVREGDSHDSLALIAALIEPGQTVLDLGMGTGALGHYLSQRQACVVDGVTLNPAEAAIARSWYRQALVADLDRDSLDTMLGGQRYDCIVCADVLEHLKAPQNILAQCKALLQPGGRIVASIPNAGYCGLVAELMQGDFRYRPEGLLDNTHLRFFTRTSVQRFFTENGWHIQSIQTTQRSLPASEFRIAFDSLPPAVARYLLALPDALTYQFISVLQPQDHAGPGAASVVAAAPAVAFFSAELYLATDGHFSEDRKQVASGRIGDPQQTLVFDIPASAAPYTQLRFDPADRPGFFRLHRLAINRPDGQPVWHWQAGQDPLATLNQASMQQVLLASPWENAAGVLLLLHGEDPWIELPLEPGLLQEISRTGATLEVGAGWPMLADYLQASAAMSTLQVEHQQSLALLHQEVERLAQSNVAQESARRELQSRLDEREARLTTQLTAYNELVLDAKNEKQKLLGELRAAVHERSVLANQFRQLALHLQGIEQSTVFRATRPLVHLKMRLDRLLGRSGPQGLTPQAAPRPQPVAASRHPVDIIVPVYRGLEDTRCCLESVLNAPGQTAWRLIIINDCSPEPEVSAWLRTFAGRDARITLLENPLNLGFVGSVNRGMALSPEHDVVLLNSDAEVANDWLDRLARAAHSAPRVASVTPFSNNATICSYPRFCQANELPAGHDTASLDRLFAGQLAGQSLEIPTGVGFCMYIRRQCLQETGLFDVANFGQGYGEENDFCVRAQELGWSHLHALDTFVRHAGGISFGDSKNQRELQAMETLRRLHPGYEAQVHAFVQRDPARLARLTIDVARITASARPVILNVMHNREGGTLRHVQELARQLAGQATFLRLSSAPNGAELRLEGPHEAFALHFALPGDWPRLLQTLGTLQVGHIHYHHLLGHAPQVCGLPAQLGVSYDFTAHDYYSYCPQISLTDHTDNYCGEQGIEQCRQCLQRSPAPGGESIDSWRERHARLLGAARFVIAPSADTAQRMQRFVPGARVQVLPHATLETLAPVYPQPAPGPLPAGRALKIVVLGALSKIKGADVLEEVATLAARDKVALEFHLLGYAYRSLRSQPRARLTVHGGYEEKDLAQLLQWLQPDAVWFPALWPETYSYTLSASLESGLPIIAPNLGAFAERLQKRDWTWLCDWQQSPGQWLEFFSHIRQHHFCTASGPGWIAAPTRPGAAQNTGDDVALAYRSSYLLGLPLPVAVPLDQLPELLQQVAASPMLRRGVIRSTALRALMRLRASRLLSPVSRVVPFHLQRRVKSWLGQ